MNILYTTPVLSHPAAGGPALRVENSIKALNQISKLYIIARLSRTQIGGKIAEEFYRQLSYNFEFVPSAVLNNRFPNVTFNIKYIREGVNLCIRAMRKIIGLLFRVDDAGYICEYIGKHNIDVVWFGFGNISYDLMKKLRERLPEIKMVCDTDSVWSRFLLRELPYENNPTRKKEIQNKGKRKEFEEKHWVEFMDVTTAVSEIDAEYYRQFTEDEEKIRIFSNVIDLQTYAQIPSPIVGLKKPCIYLAGTFGHPHSPMDRAARWMIEEVLPLVKQEIANVHFYMVGRGSQVVWGGLNDPTITVTGKVPSVLEYLCYADVAVVPLQFESGTRFKILEAGACQIPIVSTTLGAEGLPVTHGQEILLADTPKDFAKSIIRLINDKNMAGQLCLNCQKLVKKRFSVEYLMTEAQRILEILVSDNNRE